MVKEASEAGVAHAVGLQEVGVGCLLRRGVLQQGLEPLADFEQPQALQMLLEALELRRAHDPAPLRSRAKTSS
jgi:hypothetical protein